jgi:hypothetical protein
VRVVGQQTSSAAAKGEGDINEFDDLTYCQWIKGPREDAVEMASIDPAIARPADVFSMVRLHKPPYDAFNMRQIIC